ncbi:MAG TPA: VWA domain-containing protein [Acidimicrobiales bacterium]|nr:VWA domain-containing protein [Acidimicrobiales bacterium]
MNERTAAARRVDPVGPDDPVDPVGPDDPVGRVVMLARALRRHQVPASPDRVHAWLEALDLLDPALPLHVYRAGRLTMCSRPEELATFDLLFASYLYPPAGPETPEPPPAAGTPLAVSLGGSVGAEGELEPADEDVEIPTASSLERIADRDLAELAALDPSLFRLLANVFAGSHELRRAARSRPAPRGRPDRARTLRRIVSQGGEVAEIAYLRRCRRPRRLVLLVDVSGSMAAYGEALLRFAHAAGRRRAPQTEVFTIGTRLTRVTPMLGTADGERAVRDVMAAVVDRGGGTRLGELLKEFLDTWGQRGLARGSVVAVLSDGWERGDPAELGRQMARLGRLAHKVVWANPHKAQPGFEPLAGGMAAALPYLDDFVEGHSFAALSRLAATLVGSAGDPAGRGPGASARRQTGGLHAGAR